MKSSGRRSQRSSAIASTAASDNVYEESESAATDLIASVKAPSPAPLVIEKIIGKKTVENQDDPSIVEDLFYIKWKKLSYLHASWEKRDEVEQLDPQAKTKFKRYLQPIEKDDMGDDDDRDEENSFDPEQGNRDDEFFNPEFVEVHRIISCDSAHVRHARTCRTDSPSRRLKPSSSQSVEELVADTSEDEVLYLVKWRGQGYNDSTWEEWADLKEFHHEVERFWEIQVPPSRHEIGIKRPSISDYTKLSESPKFGAEEFTGNELTLRNYQLEGVNWLLWNWWHDRPCILADEIGLGKTIQALSFLHQLRVMPTTRVRGPFLIVVPLALIDQWQSEINMWSPQMNCVVLHGSTEARELIVKHEFYYTEPYVSQAKAQNLKESNVCKFHILLTTFEIAIKDVRVLSKIEWEVVVVDEAHRLKNPAAKSFEQLSSIPHKHCVFLTGAPLQSKTEDVWPLLHFADKTRFNTQAEFLRELGDLNDTDRPAQLQKLLELYLLRRTKEEVEGAMRPNEETIIEVALTDIQKQYYRAIYEQNTSVLFKGAKSRNQSALMNVMMELRKCCNHPYLVKGADLTGEQLALAEGKAGQGKAGQGKAGQGKAGQSKGVQAKQSRSKAAQAERHRKLVESSGKLLLLDKLLPKLHADGHKVLIFSQMVQVLGILEEYLTFRGYAYERLDASTRVASRNEAVARFSRSESGGQGSGARCCVMLLSARLAGGLGLNLTAADTVIVYDSDWNPRNDFQAQARAHRIGQTRAVTVYRLLTRKSYEMHMFHQACAKLGVDTDLSIEQELLPPLADEATEKPSSSSGSSSSSKRSSSSAAAAAKAAGGVSSAGAGGGSGSAGRNSTGGGGGGGGGTAESSGRLMLSAKEIEELLKRGAYEVFRDRQAEPTAEAGAGAETVGAEGADSDIDSILLRRSHKVSFDGGGASSTVSVISQLGDFCQASFTSADEKETVDISDLDFWSKAIGLVNPVEAAAAAAAAVAALAAVEASAQQELVPSQRKRRAAQIYGDDETVDTAQLARQTNAERREQEKKEKERDRKEQRVDKERKEQDKERKEQERVQKKADKERKEADVSDAKATKAVKVTKAAAIQEAKDQKGREKSDKNEKGEKAEKGEKTDKNEKGEKSEKIDKVEKSEKNRELEDKDLRERLKQMAREKSREKTREKERAKEREQELELEREREEERKREEERLREEERRLEEERERERYEARRASPMLWGAHARDRVLRAASLFGYGRWTRVQSESGGEQRIQRDLQIFSRSFFLFCGSTLLAESERNANKSEFEFVNDSVAAAKTLEVISKASGFKFELPAAMAEERFVLKHKPNTARKILNRFDVMFSLVRLVGNALEHALITKMQRQQQQQQQPLVASSSGDSTVVVKGGAKGGAKGGPKGGAKGAAKVSQTALAVASPVVAIPHSLLEELDVDKWFQHVSVQELSETIPLGDVRPSWAHIAPWWDCECDRHLLIGVFKHGYGRYELLRDDPTLCFQRKIKAYNAPEPAPAPVPVPAQVAAVKVKAEAAAPSLKTKASNAAKAEASAAVGKRKLVVANATNAASSSAAGAAPLSAGAGACGGGGGGSKEGVQQKAKIQRAEPAAASSTAAAAAAGGVAALAGPSGGSKPTAGGARVVDAPAAAAVRVREDKGNENMADVAAVGGTSSGEGGSTDSPLSRKRKSSGSHPAANGLQQQMSVSGDSVAVAATAAAAAAAAKLVTPSVITGCEAVNGLDGPKRPGSQDGDMTIVTSELSGPGGAFSEGSADADDSQWSPDGSTAQVSPDSCSGGAGKTHGGSKTMGAKARGRTGHGQSHPIRLAFAGGRQCVIEIASGRVSQFKGVFSQPGSPRWIVYYCEDSVTPLGSYDLQVEAALAYDAEARKRHGAEAVCNFLATGERNPSSDSGLHELSATQMPSHKTSKYRGVRAVGSKWTGQISYENSTHHLGTHTSEIEAAVAYDRAARDRHGKDALVNFPAGVEREALLMLREAGVTLTLLATDGSVERVINGGPGVYEGLQAEGFIAQLEELARVEAGVSAEALLSGDFSGQAGAAAAAAAAVAPESGRDIKDAADGSSQRTQQRISDTATAEDSSSSDAAMAIVPVSIPSDAAESKQGDAPAEQPREAVAKTQTQKPPAPKATSVAKKKRAAAAAAAAAAADENGIAVDKTSNKVAKGKEDAGRRTSSSSSSDAADTLDDMDCDDDGNDIGGGKGKTGSMQLMAGKGEACMPDARTLNRLLLWLLSSEMARMRQLEMKERQVRYNRKKANDAPAASKPGEDASKPVFQTEEQILTRAINLFDLDAMALVFKEGIGGIDRCKGIVAAGKRLIRDLSAASKQTAAEGSADGGNGGRKATSGGGGVGAATSGPSNGATKATAGGAAPATGAAGMGGLTVGPGGAGSGVKSKPIIGPRKLVASLADKTTGPSQSQPSQQQLQETTPKSSGSSSSLSLVGTTKITHELAEVLCASFMLFGAPTDAATECNKVPRSRLDFIGVKPVPLPAPCTERSGASGGASGGVTSSSAAAAGRSANKSAKSSTESNAGGCDDDDDGNEDDDDDDEDEAGAGGQKGSSVPTAVKPKPANKGSSVSSSAASRRAAMAAIPRLEVYSWKGVQRQFCPAVPISALETFYKETFLPFSITMCRGGLKFSSSSKLRIVPNAMCRATEHHQAARGLCMIFMQRQQIRRACAHVLTHLFSPLWEHLRSSDGRSFKNMPYWWDPCTHDVALLVSCVRHGYLNLEALRKDTLLPFTRQAIRRHLHYRLVYGSASLITESLGDEISSTPEQIGEWLDAAAKEFPSFKTLQLRLESLLEEMTQSLQAGHLCKVKAMLHSFMPQEVATESEEKSSGVVEDMIQEHVLESKGSASVGKSGAGDKGKGKGKVAGGAIAANVAAAAKKVAANAGAKGAASMGPLANLSAGLGKSAGVGTGGGGVSSSSSGGNTASSGAAGKGSIIASFFVACVAPPPPPTPPPAPAPIVAAAPAAPVAGTAAAGGPAGSSSSSRSSSSSGSSSGVRTGGSGSTAAGSAGAAVASGRATAGGTAGGTANSVATGTGTGAGNNPAPTKTTPTVTAKGYGVKAAAAKAAAAKATAAAGGALVMPAAAVTPVAVPRQTFKSAAAAAAANFASTFGGLNSSSSGSSSSSSGGGSASGSSGPNSTGSSNSNAAGGSGIVRSGSSIKQAAAAAAAAAAIAAAAIPPPPPALAQVAAPVERASSSSSSVTGAASSSSATGGATKVGGAAGAAGGGVGKSGKAGGKMVSKGGKRKAEESSAVTSSNQVQQVSGFAPKVAVAASSSAPKPALAPATKPAPAPAVSPVPALAPLSSAPAQATTSAAAATSALTPSAPAGPVEAILLKVRAMAKRRRISIDDFHTKPAE